MKDKKGILIADSGSTKTAWIYLNAAYKEQFLTGGANPFFRNTGDLRDEWKLSPLNQLKGNVAEIHFYAAGVVNAERGSVIEKALRYFFPEATIEVESDLLAAARATLGRESGIACILGTGSNSCRYDGKSIIEHVSPLGFILGDEGSGAVLGRHLLGDYLKNIMPAELRDLFNKEYSMSYVEILNRVYRQEKPNMFLAQFAPFLKKYISYTYCEKLVSNSFSSFIERNVMQYKDFKNQPISFAGSVAFYFEEQLQKELLTKNLLHCKIVKEPIEGLINFHTQHQ